MSTRAGDEEPPVDRSTDDAEAWEDQDYVRRKGASQRGTSEERTGPNSSDSVMPQSTRDDTDAGWGEQRRDNLERLLAERPPHWDR